ncbi:hypothetical protein L1987_42384 [Smallanthus sonchifolius]|uniref:Uncharacterized protein n=1 Tax=Smallanthus sonchifolius TaxID=185202 RepID=A0ACB9GJB5_9ASTR|nr:hypothetical protein L1987_42384 [Smallanthus sonchifolius]
MEGLTILLIFFGASCSILTCSVAVDTLSPTELIEDGDTIVSSGGMYELGFFSPGNSRNRYLGVRYKKVSNGTVVWIANRDTPLNTTSGILKLNSNGILQIVSDGNTNTTIWSSSSVNIINPVAQRLDDGNLVIREGSRNIWQSFDYPGNTYLRGMKLGKDLITGIDRQWISWKNFDDTSPGEYVVSMDMNGFPQIFQKWGSVLHTRFGPWNGVRFSGMPSLNQNPTSENEFVVNEEEIYYKIVVDSSVVSRMYLSPEGDVRPLNWVNHTQRWRTNLASVPTDSCSLYGVCGPYGTCNIRNFPICSCMEGFEPKRPEEWGAGAWFSGCVPRTPLDCVNGNEDGFRSVSGVKLQGTRSSWYDFSMNLDECETECLKNCSCTAYANLDIRNGGSGCLLWFDEIMDIREYNETQYLHIRLAQSELTRLTLAMHARIKKKRSYMKRQDSLCDRPKEDIDLPSFSLSTIAKSTSNFSIANKLGQGGFGPVYKGVLEDGREIAVKQLSKSSRQGLDEFKNEVRLVTYLRNMQCIGYSQLNRMYSALESWC